MRLILQLRRVLDEIVHSEARGLSRKLYLEAKGLELLALVIAELEESERRVALLRHALVRQVLARRRVSVSAGSSATGKPFRNEVAAKRFRHGRHHGR